MANGSGTGIAIILTAALFIGVGSLMKGSEPKCRMGGCDRERTEDSEYCMLHDISYKSHGDPDYHTIYQEGLKRSEEAKAKIDEEYRAGKNSSSSSRSTYNSYSSKSNPSNKSNKTRSYAPYELYEYDNGDDFAEEWAEEFGDGSFEDGYDDAYDYWEDTIE